MSTVPDLHVEGAIARITLRRPEQANRLEPDDLATLADLLNEVNATPGIRVLMLQSQGKYFCSGYDIARIGSARPVQFDDVTNALEDCRPITLAVLHGPVYGGATDLALACDFRVGAEGIEMFMPAAKLGVHFYQRGLERYVSRIGIDNAKRLFLTAERIDAEEMRSMGFLTHLYEAQALQAEVGRLAATLAGSAPLALLPMKKHMNSIARGMLDVDELARDMGVAINSADRREGQLAWKEKRTPVFSGN